MYVNLTSNKNNIETNINIPWNVQRVRYWISKFQTSFNAYYLTNEDWIMAEELNGNNWNLVGKYNFNNTYTTINANIIESINFGNRNISFNVIDNEIYIINIKANKIRLSGSSRVRIIMNFNNNDEYEPTGNNGKLIGSLEKFYNFHMFLISKNGSNVKTNNGTMNILANIDGYFKRLMPVLCNIFDSNRIVVETNKQSIEHFECVLTDENFEPIPMIGNYNISLYIEPV